MLIAFIFLFRIGWSSKWFRRPNVYFATYWNSKWRIGAIERSYEITDFWDIAMGNQFKKAIIILDDEKSISLF